MHSSLVVITYIFIILAQSSYQKQLGEVSAEFKCSAEKDKFMFHITFAEIRKNESYKDLALYWRNDSGIPWNRYQDCKKDKYVFSCKTNWIDHLELLFQISPNTSSQHEYVSTTTFHYQLANETILDFYRQCCYTQHGLEKIVALPKHRAVTIKWKSYEYDQELFLDPFRINITGENFLQTQISDCIGRRCSKTVGYLTPCTHYQVCVSAFGRMFCPYERKYTSTKCTTIKTLCVTNTMNWQDVLIFILAVLLLFLSMATLGFCYKNRERLRKFFRERNIDLVPRHTEPIYDEIREDHYTSKERSNGNFKIGMTDDVTEFE